MMHDFYEYRELTWENSLEGVLSRLDVVGACNASSFKDEVFIVKTLLRLPEDVREKVLREVSFILMNGETLTVKKCLHVLLNRNDLRATELEGEYIANFKRTFIVLNFRDINDWNKMDYIAHEIAHFMAGRLELHYDKDYEEQIQILLRKWEFEKREPHENMKKNRIGYLL